MEAQLNVNTDIALMWLELQDFDLVRYILIDEPIAIFGLRRRVRNGLVVAFQSLMNGLKQVNGFLNERGV